MAYTPTNWECGQTVTSEKLNNIERGVAEVNSEYTPTTWQCGDVITAEAMNKIEQGIANAGSGGSSDFSTAKVTNAGETLFGGDVALISEDDQSEPYAVFLPNATKEVILYKGRAKLDFFSESSGSIATTGAIAYDAENGCYIITGDCTITIS